MEKGGNGAPSDASKDGENGPQVSTMDELQGSSLNPTKPSSNQGETTIQDEAELFDQNDEKANELGGGSVETIHSAVLSTGLSYRGIIIDKRIRDMIAKLDEIGPTISRYQYEEASNEVQRLSSEMKEKALATMIQHLQLEEAKTAPKINQSSKKLSPAFLEMEIKLKDLEKQSNKVARRINEHKREQAHTLQKLQMLEARALHDEKKDFIKDIMTRVPTETDLQNLETIRQMLIEKKCTESRIQALNMRASALDKAMGAIAKSKWHAGRPPQPKCIRTVSPCLPQEINTGASNRDINTGIESHELNTGIDSREMNTSIDSRETTTGIDGNEMDSDIDNRMINVGISSREIHKKKQLQDFTRMPAAKRESFLAKRFSQSSPSDSQNGQNRLSFLNAKKRSMSPLEAGEEEAVPSDDKQKGGSDDGSGKSSEHSGITIVTMNSDETDVNNSGRQQVSEPGTAVDNGESVVPDEVTRRSPENGPREHENPSGKGTE